MLVFSEDTAFPRAGPIVVVYAKEVEGNGAAVVLLTDALAIDNAEDVESVWWYWPKDAMPVPFGNKSWLYVTLVPGTADDKYGPDENLLSSLSIKSVCCCSNSCCFSVDLCISYLSFTKGVKNKSIYIKLPTFI